LMKELVCPLSSTTERSPSGGMLGFTSLCLPFFFWNNDRKEPSPPSLPRKSIEFWWRTPHGLPSTLRTLQTLKRRGRPSFSSSFLSVYDDSFFPLTSGFNRPKLLLLYSLVRSPDLPSLPFPVDNKREKGHGSLPFYKFR